jgi:50S ribosomal protein L16 3-hydroxylase
MVPDFSLDKNFWRRFARTYWNRRPTVIRAPFRNSIVTPAEVFRAVASATRRLREPTDDFSFRLDTGRVVLDADLDRWIPRAEDVSIERYFSRIGRSAAGRQFAIFVSDFQIELGWVFFTRLQQFLKGLYEIEGVPANRAEVDLFFGNYRRTHTGVHRDSADVFCFVVDGRKCIRAWPADAVPSSSPVAGPASYGRFLNRSICLEGEPGDIIYWPSSYWHVAESGGRLGSSLSLGLYYGSGLARTIVPGLEAGSREILGGDKAKGSLPFSDQRAMLYLASSAERLGRESERLTRGLMRFWMDRITGYGFARIPRARGRVPLRLGQAVRANPASPILCRKFNHDLVVSANGRSIAISYHRNVVELIRTLNRGQDCLITDLLEEDQRRQQRPSRGVRRALMFLLDVRAVEYA